MNPETTPAIAEWKSLLGPEWASDSSVTREHHQKNLTEFTRSMLAVLSPSTLDELGGALRIARRYRIPVAPVSQGRNWGQGSALPAQDGVALLRLHRMNRILEVNERMRYAVIEPGVTQGQLAQHLREHHPQLIFNMTGSGLDTSVVGNVLERGAAIYGQRIRDLRSMEIMLADGTLIKTGLWHFGGHRLHHYVHGLGPDLNGLFAQSNLGVVTKMVIGLRPRIEQEVVCIHFTKEQLCDITDRLFFLRESHILAGGPVTVNRMDHRIRDVGSAQLGHTNWLTVSSLEGSTAIRKVKREELEYAFRSLPVQLKFFQLDQADDPQTMPFLATMLRLLDGQPSNFSLEMFRRFLGSSDQSFTTEHGYDLDRDPASPGMSCVLPAVPFEGAAVSELVDLVQSFSASCPFQVGFTFVTHDTTTLEGFLRIIFDRSKDAEVQAAKLWSQNLYKELKSHGFFPYRLHLDVMEQYTSVEGDTFWQTIRKIKDTLDPEEILSPGRYCPKRSEFALAEDMSHAFGE